MYICSYHVVLKHLPSTYGCTISDRSKYKTSTSLTRRLEVGHTFAEPLDLITPLPLFADPLRNPVCGVSQTEARWHH